MLCKGLRPLHPRPQTACGTYSPRRSGTRRAACLAGRRVNLPHHRFIAPIPPTPLPGGKGEPKVILCKGLRPLHPRRQTACGTYRPCRTGARRLNPGGVTRREPLSFGFVANHGFNPGDARGGSPLHKKTKILPLPHGGRALCERGQGGWGQETYDAAETSGDQSRHPPLPPNLKNHKRTETTHETGKHLHRRRVPRKPGPRRMGRNSGLRNKRKGDVRRREDNNQ